VNLIGEHTDYNQGLALPFAIAQGVTVQAEALQRSPLGERIDAYASDLNEHDEFMLGDRRSAQGWRAFVRGTVAELSGAGYPLRGARLEISGNVPQGSGLSSSAALGVALCLALTRLGSGSGSRRDSGSDSRGRGSESGSHRDSGSGSGSDSGSNSLSRGSGSGSSDGSEADLDCIAIARLCSRVENHWVGAHTGLLDQLASLYGAPDTALCIDFDTLQIDPVPLQLGAWRLALLDSSDRHAHASSGYNERRSECAMACDLLDVKSLRQASLEAAAKLPEPLDRRVAHVLSENARVQQAVAALQAADLPALGRLLDASHASLLDSYQVSTPAVEAAVQRLRRAGAAGARMIGGGFGGSVLGLFPPATALPAGTYEVRPSAGAHLVSR
jgi:galactokinase